MTTGEESTVHEIEEGTDLRLDFQKLSTIATTGAKVIPVAVQHADTKEVILVAYVNEEALQRSISSRIATFWSTSRNALWIKGEESGNSFELIEIRVNCEQNSLLYLVRPKGGGICHTKNSQGHARNCDYRRLDLGAGVLENLDA